MNLYITSSHVIASSSLYNNKKLLKKTIMIPLTVEVPTYYISLCNEMKKQAIIKFKGFQNKFKYMSIT